MNCCDCHDRLADLSAGTLDAGQTQAVQLHVEQCAHCAHEWVVFEHTLFLVSTTHQVLPTPLATEQMWHSCMEHIFEKVESGRLQTPPPAYAGVGGWRGWLARQPRWSWAGLAGAFALFGAVWFLAPQDDVANPNDGLPPEGQLVVLQNPPAVAAGLINHHAATTVDPFNDYAGKTLVSYSVSPSTGTRP